MGRTRRALTVAMTAAVAVATVVMSPGVADGSGRADAVSCRVVNLRTGQVGSDLQGAVDQAAAGDTLKLAGTCGAVTIGVSLRLVGPAAIAAPVCEQCGAGTMVWVSAPAVVTLKDLLVTGGFSSWDAGGLYNEGTVVLAGRTSIRGNQAEDNAAGVANYGRLVLTDHATVTGNSLYFRGDGGGILNHGSLYLREYAAVTGNAGTRGAGVFNAGTAVVSGRARISGNSAETGGGVYNDATGTLVLRGASRIVCNSAPGWYDDTGQLVSTGGGVFTAGTVRIDRHWRGVVRWNTPDNWDRPAT